MTDLGYLGLAAVAVLVGLAYYSFRVEPFRIDVRRVEVPLPRLPQALDGVRVAQISDLHFGLGVPPDFVGRAISICADAHPDLVVVTGDIVERGVRAPEAAAALAKLRPLPVYAVLGNHDYKAGERRARALAQSLREAGLVVLENEAVPLDLRGSRLWIVGLDDPCSRHADLSRALTGLGPDDHPRLLLAHSPEAVLDLAEGDADLVLAGHTHGGQVYVPLLTAALLRLAYSRFAAGLYRHNGTTLYVNRGLGSLGIPARFLRPPEVTLLTLRAIGPSRGEAGG